MCGNSTTCPHVWDTVVSVGRRREARSDRDHVEVAESGVLTRSAGEEADAAGWKVSIGDGAESRAVHEAGECVAARLHTQRMRAAGATRGGRQRPHIGEHAELAEARYLHVRPAIVRDLEDVLIVS